MIDLREKYTLFKCLEALENTNKSIDQQRAQVERWVGYLYILCVNKCTYYMYVNVLYMLVETSLLGTYKHVELSVFFTLYCSLVG